jgi:hypothetical protein
MECPNYSVKQSNAKFVSAELSTPLGDLSDIREYCTTCGPIPIIFVCIFKCFSQIHFDFVQI